MVDRIMGLSLEAEVPLGSYYNNPQMAWIRILNDIVKGPTSERLERRNHHVLGINLLVVGVRKREKLEITAIFKDDEKNNFIAK